MSTAPAPTSEDLRLLGAAVWNLVATTVQLGHTSPVETLDYAGDLLAGPGVTSAAPAIVADLVAWSGRHPTLAPLAEARLRAYVDACGWREDMTVRVFAP